EIRDVTFPAVVRATDNSTDDHVAEDTGIAAADDSAIGGAPLDATTKLAAEPKPIDPAISAAGGTTRLTKEQETRLEDVDAFVDFFITVGKKGIAINRYKGLGEMNPETLWATTMDPE